MSEQIDGIRQLAEMPYSGIREEKEKIEPKNRTLEVGSSSLLEKLELEYVTLKRYDAYEAQLDCLSKILKIKQNNPSALFIRGTILLKLERYEEAIDAFNEKMLSVTTDADTYYNKAIAHYELDQWEETVTNTKKAREIRPESADAWRLEGSVLDDLERYEEAIKCFDEAIRLNPNHVIAWRHKGISLNHGLKKFKEAITCFEEVIRLDPEEKKVYLNMASAYEELDDFDTAISYYDKAIEKDPKWIAAVFDKAVTYEIDICDNEKAVECFNQVIKMKTKSSKDLYCRMYALMKLERWQEAIECCEERLNIIPIKDGDKRMYLKRQAFAFNELKKYEEAIACCNKALEIKDDDWSALLRKGFAYGELKKHEEAIECYDKVLAIEAERQGFEKMTMKVDIPFTEEVENMGTKTGGGIDILNALNNKRWSLAKLNRHEEAVECSKRFLILQPANETHQLLMGYSLRESNRFEEALACYEQIIENYNRRKETNEKGLAYGKILSKAWNDKGVVLHHMDRYEGTLECFEKALESWPKNTMALTNKGDFLRVMNKNEEALTCYDKAISINPNDANTWEYKGKIEIGLGRFIEAGESLERALEIDKWHKWTMNSKAELYFKQGKIKDAERQIDVVLERYSTFSNAWDTKSRLKSELKEFDEAIKCSDMAIKFEEDETIDSTLGVWLNNKADILMESVEKKTPQESVKILEKALEISNEAIKKAPRRGIYHYTKGEILEKLGKEEEAKELFEKAKELGYIEEED